MVPKKKNNRKQTSNETVGNRSITWTPNLATVKNTRQIFEQLLRGNDDVNTAVKNELLPPIVGANLIRILPYSQHLRTICLRFELHGCQYDGK